MRVRHAAPLRRNFVVELPFARAARPGKALLGDWTVSGIYAYRSGRPFTVTQGSNNVGQGTPGCRTGSGIGEGPETVDKWFEPADFQAVPSGTFGNAGRNILRGPDWQSLDLSLQKDFPVRRATSTCAGTCSTSSTRSTSACPTPTSRTRPRWDRSAACPATRA